MSRITLVDPAAASPEATALLNTVRQAFGATPNLFRALANAPVALEGLLGFHVIAGKGALTPATRERIALAVAEQNGCEYCLSAHSALGRAAGLSPEEIAAARRGSASDAKAAAAVALSRALVTEMGRISDAEYAAARAVLSEEELVEVIAHTALNIFTNIFNNATRIPVDFPRVALLSAA